MSGRLSRANQKLFMKRKIRNMFMRSGITLVIYFFFLNIAFGQSLNTVKLDSLINTLSKNNLALGSLAICKNGSVLYQRAFGHRIIEDDKRLPADVFTKYRIGSITKLFTAVLVFQMIEHGKLQLSTTLDKFFPGLPRARQITIRELLYHRSGLHDYTVETGFETWKNKPQTHEEMLKIIVDKGIDFEPNEKASYCNSNYLILGYIVEMISGRNYRQLIEQNIISKLGLLNTYYGESTGIDNESISYRYSVGKWEKETETDMSIHGGAGSIVSTPTDLAIFIDALFSEKLLGQKSIVSMKTLVDGYGMGIFPFPFQEKTGFGHGGRMDGFASALQYFPDDKVAVAYCSNGLMFPKDDILNGILSICFDKAYSIPQFESTKIVSGDLNQYLGTYVSATLPIKVTCSESNGSLIVETKGQPFPAQRIGKDTFMNVQYGFLFEFKPGTLILKEGDQVYSLIKQ
jgi:D-alanyl-D-alanine carboxypeptidase